MRPRRFVRLATGLLTLITSTVLAQRAGPGRIVETVEVDARGDQADIVLAFGCAVSYLTHEPASGGRELHLQLRLLPECGVASGALIAGELPAVSGDPAIVEGARLEAAGPNQALLTLSFAHPEHWVVAQGADAHGMRVRLLGRGVPQGRVLVAGAGDAVANYAVNLEAQREPFDATALAAVSARLGATAYVSELLLDDVRWYRLRVGPFDSRKQAEVVLARALAEYPRAWLAVGDDVTTTDGEAAPAAVAATVERIGSDAPLPTAQRDALVHEAQAAFARRDYAAAIAMLTKLQRQGEFPARAAMQELLGLAHERSGHVAQAIAEYEEYLRRYPSGAAVARTRARLAALRSAGEAARSLGQRTSTNGWQISGGFGQSVRYDGTQASTGGTLTNAGNVVSGTVPVVASANTASTNQTALYNDLNVLARERTDRYTLVARFSGDYAHDFNGVDAFGGTANTYQVNLASVEVSGTGLSWLVRAGRQVRNEGGILGTFDGLLASYQVRPAWNLVVAAGFPVELVSVGPQTARHFESLELQFAPTGAHLDASVFFNSQQFDGLRDREAIGGNVRYLAGPIALTGLLDYDVAYRSLNAASVLGTLRLPARWTVSLDAEQRNAPVLATANALIGQAATTLTQLEDQYTPGQIEQLARDRTAASSNLTLSAYRPLGDRLQLAFTAAADRIGATPASGGVAATPGTGLETTYQVQLSAASYFLRGDFHTLSLMHANTETGQIDEIGAASRFALGGAWHLGPNLAVERRRIRADGSRELDLLPALLLDYQRRGWIVQFDAGGQIGTRSMLEQQQHDRQDFLSLSYRHVF